MGGSILDGPSDAETLSKLDAISCSRMAMTMNLAVCICSAVLRGSKTFIGSPNGTSDDDQNEQMDDLEEAEAEGDGEPEVEEEEEEEEEMDNGVDEDVAEDEHTFPQHQNSETYFAGSPSRRAEKQPAHLVHSGAVSSDLNGMVVPDDSFASVSTAQPRPAVLPTSPSPQVTATTFPTTSIERPRVRSEALTAPVYDIVPTIAAPHSTSINAIAATPDLRWVFSGGADGYIRKFNWVETANGKVMLTVAQRHPFVDSVTKAGVLTSYWENEEPQCMFESYLVSPQLTSFVASKAGRRWPDTIPSILTCST